MSREIKFRAWDESDNMMYYGIQNGIEFDDGSRYNAENFFGEQSTHDYHRWTLMQFTGLRDRNGKEIWEGDILKITDPYNELTFNWDVQWSNDVAGWYLESPEGFSGPYDDYDTSTIGFEMSVGYQFEVIGNRFEHPELLDKIENQTENAKST